jgi:hypothetical protein
MTKKGVKGNLPISNRKSDKNLPIGNNRVDVKDLQKMFEHIWKAIERLSERVSELEAK